MVALVCYYWRDRVFYRVQLLYLNHNISPRRVRPMRMLAVIRNNPAVGFLTGWILLLDYLLFPTLVAVLGGVAVTLFYRKSVWMR